MNLVFGTMNLGPQVNLITGKEMISSFLAEGYREIDTAFVYNDGTTEEMLGQILPDIRRTSFSIATKINPRITGKLDGEAVTYQFNQSLKRLNIDKIDILYFHFPDSRTPIDSALKAINRLYENNKIKEFGLSNFPAWLVVDIWYKCNLNGWLPPTVYQGRYNGLSRNVESELFPALRHLNMRFYAYNPLAGGMLTGKHLDFEAPPQTGRFARLQSYRKRFWKRTYFDAVNLLTKKCTEFNIKPVEAAYRWLFYHSLLQSQKNDGIIIGVSSIDQMNQNISSIEKGQLPKEIIDAFDTAWSEAKPESPEYFNFFDLSK